MADVFSRNKSSLFFGKLKSGALAGLTIVLLLAALALNSCSSRRVKLETPTYEGAPVASRVNRAGARLESDIKDRGWQTGEDAWFFATSDTVPGTDENYRFRGNPSDEISAGEEAAFAAIFAGAYLAANPDYYKKAPRYEDIPVIRRRKSISGQCKIRTSPKISVTQPCHNIFISLNDLNGKEISRSHIIRGLFGFFVEKGKSYSLKVHSTMFRPLHPVRQPLIRGDQVNFILVGNSK